MGSEFFPAPFFCLRERKWVMQTVEETYEERIRRERRDEEARNEKTRALILEVLKILKFTPAERKDESCHYVYVDAKKGEQSIHFSSGGYQMKERIKISGTFPRTEKGESIDPYRYGEKRHEITVSISKPSKQIARDIERRFLPRYRELFSSVIEKVNKSNVYARACARNLELIKGAPLTENELKEHTWRFSGSVFGEVWVDNESARIELHSVPIETAKKIMAIVKSCD